MAGGAGRSIRLTRLSHGRYQATNARGGTIVFSSNGDESFSPVELFLAAIAGCTAIDVDFIVSKRAEPEHANVTMSAQKVRDEHGNHLVDLTMSFDIAFPESEGGDAAREVLPMAITRSHDYLCTVGRTVELGAPVTVVVGDPQEVNGSPDATT